MATLNVSERITTALSGLVDLYYGVADTDVYPYVIYTVESEPKYTKDGIYKYVCAVRFGIVGNTFDSVDELSAIVDHAIKDLQSADLKVVEGSCQPGPDEDNMWIVLREYSITQSINN